MISFIDDFWYFVFSCEGFISSVVWSGLSRAQFIIGFYPHFKNTSQQFIIYSYQFIHTLNILYIY